MEYFFTADEHYGHKNVIKYCNRPYANITEMDAALIANHNAVVGPDDIVYHLGDFTLRHNAEKIYHEYIAKLLGTNFFIKGSHDYWLKGKSPTWMIEKTFNGQFIVMCHYAMRVWARSHYNTWQLYGHSHGNLSPVGKQWDVGVDNNNYAPVSLTRLKGIMDLQPDNFNLVERG